MDQFLTGDIWGKVNKLITGKTKKIACIAYVTSEKLYLSKGDVLVCDASEFAIKFGQTSAVTLQNYFNRGIAIYSNSQLHAKLLLTETFLAIGSANLSKSSAEKLTESSVRFHNESKTQSHIFPPSVILGKEKVNGYYHFHHDVSDAEEQKLSWTKFLKISNGLGVDLGKRSKTVSSEILDKLNLVWPHKTD